jgi:acetyl-CoA carboxylase biotin carboxylase subunit
VYAGYTVPPYYDSLLAKVICRAKTRDAVIAKMDRALNEFIVEGVKTTIPFQIALMRNEDFKAGNFTTSFVENFKFKQ